MAHRLVKFIETVELPSEPLSPFISLSRDIIHELTAVWFCMPIMKAIITLCRTIRRTYIITFTQNGWEIVGNVAMRIKTINFFMSFFHHFYFSLFSLLLLCRYLSLLFIIFHGIFFHMMFSSLQSKIILIQSFHLIYTLLHHFFFILIHLWFASCVILSVPFIISLIA